MRRLNPACNGPDIVTIDGAAGCWPDWLPLAAELRGEMNVWASERVRPVSMTLSKAVDDVVRLLPSDKVVLVGHSMGGYVAEALTRLAPGRVRELVLLDPSIARTMPRPLRWLDERTNKVTARLVDTLKPLWPRIGPWMRRMGEPALYRASQPRRARTDEVAATHEFWARSVEDLRAYTRWGGDIVALRKVRPLPAIDVDIMSSAEPNGAHWRWGRQQRLLAHQLRGEGAHVEQVAFDDAPHAFHLTHAHEVADRLRRWTTS